MNTKTRTLRNATLFAVALTVASGGMWSGAQAVTRHMNAPHETVSYASQDAVNRTLHGANHTPAKQGAFRDAADIHSGNVRSVVVVLP